MSRCEIGREKLDERVCPRERLRIAPFDAPGVEAVPCDLAAACALEGASLGAYILPVFLNMRRNWAIAIFRITWLRPRAVEQEGTFLGGFVCRYVPSLSKYRVSYASAFCSRAVINPRLEFAFLSAPFSSFPLSL